MRSHQSASQDVAGFFNGGFILVSDYVRMEVTLIGASWDVVAGVQAGCGLFRATF